MKRVIAYILYIVYFVSSRPSLAACVLSLVAADAGGVDTEAEAVGAAGGSELAATDAAVAVVVADDVLRVDGVVVVIGVLVDGLPLR